MRPAVTLGYVLDDLFVPMIEFYVWDEVKAMMAPEFPSPERWS